MEAVQEPEATSTPGASFHDPLSVCKNATAPGAYVVFTVPATEVLGADTEAAEEAGPPVLTTFHVRGVSVAGPRRRYDCSKTVLHAPTKTAHGVQGPL